MAHRSCDTSPIDVFLVTVCQNRKLLEQLEEQKKRLRMQTQPTGTPLVPAQPPQIGFVLQKLLFYRWIVKDFLYFILFEIF